MHNMGARAILERQHMKHNYLKYIVRDSASRLHLVLDGRR